MSGRILFCLTPEAREKTRLALIGKKKSAATKARMSIASKMRLPPSKETRQKMRDAKLGTKLTESHKRKIGESGRGRKWSKKHRQNWMDNNAGEKNHMFGKKLSQEIRAKMSASRTGVKNWAFGKKFSEEHRKRLSESHMGQIPSNSKVVYGRVKGVNTWTCFKSKAAARKHYKIGKLTMIKILRGEQTSRNLEFSLNPTP